MKKVIIILSILIASSSLYADLTLNKWKELVKMDKEVALLYLNGVARGIFWSSTMAETKHNVNIYCQPSKLALDGNNYMSILESEIKTHSYRPDEYIEMILLFGLINTFPCAQTGKE